MNITEHPLLSVVDDDESVRESLPDLLRKLGFAARAFSSAQEFLSSDSVDETKCLILDVAMPGMTGLDLQQELTRRGYKVPIIFITAQKDINIREQAFGGEPRRSCTNRLAPRLVLEALKETLK